MNELKPEDVMKALECCGNSFGCHGKECPHYETKGDCIRQTMKSALALLREKDAEIESLKKRHRGRWINNHCSICGMTPIDEELWRHMDMEPPKVEFYMLFCPSCGAIMDDHKGHNDPVGNKGECGLKHKCRAEAITEFAERLKSKYDAPNWCVWLSEIEDLEQEMKG